MNFIQDLDTKPQILIADDDPSTRMLLRATISQWNYPVIEASDGEEAWDILSRDNGPKIVTVDWMMPKIDGLSLCRKAKQLAKPPYMILLTSLTGAANQVQALDSGADDFLNKPFNFVELRSRLFVGQRIVNFAEKLDEIIKQKQSDNPVVELLTSGLFTRINDISKLLQLKMETLDEKTKSIKEDRKNIQGLIQDISSKQKQLNTEILKLGKLLEPHISGPNYNKKSRNSGKKG